MWSEGAVEVYETCILSNGQQEATPVFLFWSSYTDCMEFYSKNDPQHPLISSFMVSLWFHLIKSEIPSRVKKDVLGWVEHIQFQNT